jgi:DNA-binding response OmpR family regulator
MECLHGLAFRARERSVEWRGRSAELSYAGYSLLRLLAERHPRLVSKQEIAEHLGLRSRTDVAGNARHYVSCLRSELRAAGMDHLIVREPWIGYGLGLADVAQGARAGPSS